MIHIEQLIQYILPKSLRTRMFIIVIGGVLLTFAVSGFIHIFANFQLFTKASNNLESGLYNITRLYLDRCIKNTAQQVSIIMEHTYQDLKILADVTQQLVDNEEEFKPLVDVLVDLPYFNDRLEYNSNTRQSQNDPSEQSVVSVQHFHHTDALEITPYTKSVINNTAILDLIMPAIHNNGPEKLWTYFIGGIGASFVRMTPWNDYSKTLKYYPDHMDQEYWDYWPGIVSEWERLLLSNGHESYITTFTSYIDGTTGLLTKTIAYPVWKKDRSGLYGAVWFDLSLDNIISIIEDLTIHTSGFAFLAQEDLNVFAIPPRGLELFKLTSKFDSKYDLQRTLRESPIQDIAALKVERGNETGISYAEIEGIRYLIVTKGLDYAYKFVEDEDGSRLEKQRWILGFVVSIDEVFAAVDELKHDFNNHGIKVFAVQIGAISLIAIALIYITFRATDKTMASLTSLSQATQEIGRGNYDISVPIISNGEVGTLGNTFNDMALQIKAGFEHIATQNLLLRKEIEERQRVENALSESEERYRKVVENTQDIIVISDTHGKMVYVNPSFYRCHAIPSDVEVIGQNVFKYIAPDDHPHATESIAAIISGKPQLYNEYTCLRHDGTPFAVETSGNTLQLGNTDKYLLIIAKDITERKTHEQAIIRAKQEWEKTFDTIPDLIAILDKNHTIIRMNIAMADRIGVDISNINGKHCYEHLHGTTCPPENCPHQMVLDDGKPHEVEIYEPHLGGYFLVSTSPIIGDDGEIFGSVHVAKDITARKQAELALKDSEEKFRGIVESSPMGIHMYELNQDNKLIFTGSNPAATRILGVDNTQFIGKTIEEAFPPLVSTNLPMHYKEAAKAGTHWNTEYIEYTDNQISGIYEVRAFQTEANSMVSVFSDITKRKQAELKVIEQEQNLSITLKSIGDGVIVTDTEGHIVRMNPVAEDLCNIQYTDAHMKLFRDLFSFVHEDTRVPIEDPISQVLRNKKTTTLDDNIVMLSHTHTEFAISDSVAPIINDNGKILGAVMVFRDQTQERLQQRFIEARLELIEYSNTHTLSELLTLSLDIVCEFANSPIGFYHFVDDDQEHISLQQWSTSTLQDYCTAEGHEVHYPISSAGVWIDAVNKKAPVIHNDYESLPHKRGMPEGHAKLVRELVVPVMRSNNVVAILGIGNKENDYTEKDIKVVAYLADVTWEVVQQKRAQEYIRKERDKAQQYLDIAGVIFVALNKDGFVTLINQRGCEVLGYSHDDIIGKNWFSHFIPKHMQESFHEIFHDITYNNNIQGRQTFENPILTKDNTERIIAWSNIFLTDKNDNVIGTLSSGEDITEQKRYQEELTASKERYQDLFDNAPDMYVSVNSETGFVTQCNNTLIKATGYSRDEIIGHPVFHLYHPDSLDDAKRCFDQFVNDGFVSNAHLQLKRKDGSKIDVSLNVTSIIDENNIRHSRSSWRDITEQKKAERALQESQEQFMKLTQAPFEGIAITNKGVVLNVNDQLANMLGYNPEEMIDMNVINFVAPESQETVIQELKMNQSGPYEHLALRKDGTTFPVEVQGKSLPYKEHTVRVTAIRDITDRKNAERALRDLAKFPEENPNPILRVHSDGTILYINDAVTKSLPDLDCRIGETLPESLFQLITIPFKENKQTIAHISHKDRTFIMSIVPIIDNNYTNIYMRDISERRLAETKLKQLNDTLEQQVKDRTEKLKEAMNTLMQEEKMAALGKLVAGMVHEINTPNGVALTAASYLEEVANTLDERYNSDKIKTIRKASAMILSNLKNSTEIITNFKQLAVDQSTEDTREINLQAHLKSLLVSLHPTLKKHKHIINIDNVPSIDLLSYPGAITQIFTNLIMNSIIHGFKDIEEGEITIRATKKSQSIYIIYSDNGCGMTNEVLHHIYEPFYTTIRGKGGTGLGMNIVYNLVTSKFGGSIHCNSSPGKGVTFQIILPNLHKRSSEIV